MIRAVAAAAAALPSDDSAADVVAIIILAVALVPSVDADAIMEGHAAWTQYVPWREIVMIGAALCSLRLGDRTVRYEYNDFEFGPIQAVAALFVGIFLTMIPALAVLRAAAPSLHLNEITLFLFTGGLSSVLDNAPTYATFFEMARELGGEPAVAGVYEPYLVSISVGAVFCGAITYIGNGPNFMVKAIAESDGVEMPSFGGYVARWAVVYLLPVLVLMVGIFIVETTWVRVASGVLAALLAGWHVRSARALRR